MRKNWAGTLLPRKWTRNFLYLSGKKVAITSVLLITILIAGFGMVNKDLILSYMNRPDYTPILNTIAKGESSGNYDAYYGNASNSSIRFTKMSVREVLIWQDEYVRLGNPSNAVGKYQIVKPTLEGLVRELDIDTIKPFDAAMQDKMAIALLERRGAMEYVRGNLTREQFAANLAKEWAALPKITAPNPEQSYYAGDGLNQVRISIHEIFTALATIKN